MLENVAPNQPRIAQCIDPADLAKIAGTGWTGKREPPLFRREFSVCV